LGFLSELGLEGVRDRRGSGVLLEGCAGADCGAWGRFRCLWVSERVWRLGFGVGESAFIAYSFEEDWHSCIMCHPALLCQLSLDERDDPGSESRELQGVVVFTLFTMYIIRPAAKTEA